MRGIASASPPGREEEERITLHDTERQTVKETGKEEDSIFKEKSVVYGSLSRRTDFPYTFRGQEVTRGRTGGILDALLVSCTFFS